MAFTPTPVSRIESKSSIRWSSNGELGEEDVLNRPIDDLANMVETVKGDAIFANPALKSLTSQTIELPVTFNGAVTFAGSLAGTTFTGTTFTGTSFNSITGLSDTTPAANSTAAVGTSTTAARADHIHPLQPTFPGTVIFSGSVLNVFSVPRTTSTHETYVVTFGLTSDRISSDDYTSIISGNFTMARDESNGIYGSSLLSGLVLYSAYFSGDHDEIKVNYKYDWNGAFSAQDMYIYEILRIQ
jgi:hypothetical protein